MRTYDLSYGATIFPGVTWGASGQTFSISSIQELDANEQATMPAINFTYGYLHLIQVSNGLGGAVTFDYEDTPWYEIDSPDSYNYTTPAAYCPGQWNNVDCVGGKLYVDLDGVATYNFGNVHPGGVYSVFVELRDIDYEGDDAHATVKLQYGDNPTTDVVVLLNNVSIPDGQTASASMNSVLIPASAKFLKWVVSSDGVRIVNIGAKLRVTRYRVNTKTISDTQTGQSNTFTYEFDGAATNDFVHSYAVSQHISEHDDLYNEALSGYRGNSMAREIGPIGSDGNRSVVTSWYYQDDDLVGNTSLSMVGRRDFSQSFENTTISSYDSDWDFSPSNYSRHSIVRLEGDNGLNSTNPNADWNAKISRPAGSMVNDDTVLVQFRISGASVATELLADNAGAGSDYRRWGISVWSDGNLVAYYFPNAWTSIPTEMGIDIQKDIWYVVQLTMDNENLFARVWKRDDPHHTVAAVSYQPGETLAANTTWRFIQQTNNGTTWLDEYSEGRIYDASFSDYDVSFYNVHTAFNEYNDLKIRWTRQASHTSLTFEGDGVFVGNREYFFYDTTYMGGDYGNQTHSIQSSWDGSNWQDYRASVFRFYPRNVTGKYLVGLPAYQNQYACPSGSTEGA